MVDLSGAAGPAAWLSLAEVACGPFPLPGGAAGAGAAPLPLPFPELGETQKRLGWVYTSKMRQQKFTQSTAILGVQGCDC